MICTEVASGFAWTIFEERLHENFDKYIYASIPYLNASFVYTVFAVLPLLFFRSLISHGFYY